MKKTMRHLMIPGVIFLVFAGLSIMSDGPSRVIGARESIRFAMMFNYLIQIGVVISGLYLLNRLLNIVLWDNLISRALGTAIPRLVKDLSTVVMCIVGITIIVGVVFDRPVTGIWATSGALGVVIGFALRSLILDAFTGLAINIDNSYRIGDWVHVHSRNRIDYVGCILEINWRTTRLQTTDNNVIIIPNSLIGQSIVTNFSSPSSISRFELYFCFDAALPPARVIRVLLAGVKGAIAPRGVEAEPEPTVRINRIVDAGVEYRIRYWIYPHNISPPRARHAVIEHVLHDLHLAGIPLAHPKQDVFFARRAMPSLISDSTDDRVALLSAIDLFRQVKREALYTLASHMKRVTFKTADTVVTAGAKGDSMFIVTEGLLDVYVHDQTENREVKVGHITSGQFFGEIALLTGRPRSATVMASTDVVAYEITHDCMWEFLHQYPDMLKEISEVAANLQLNERRFLDGIHQPALVESHQSLSDEILMSIRNFFGISRRR